MNIRQFTNAPCERCLTDQLFIGFVCHNCGWTRDMKPLATIDVSNGTAARANSAAIRKRGRSFTIGGRKRIYNSHAEKLAARRKLRAERKAAGELDGII